MNTTQPEESFDKKGQRRQESSNKDEQQHNKLWGGRFSDGLNPLMEQFNAFISFDRRMWREDLEGSRVYADHLKQQHLLSEREWNAIVDGLARIGEEWRSNSFRLLPNDEDIHSANERRLKELIGPEIGGKLHTGRSRNDQVATDMKLWLRTSVQELQTHVASLITSITDTAEKTIDIHFAGYTHLQRAQPIRFSHWLMSYAWMLRQDYLRLIDLLSRSDSCPLGSRAIAGTPFDVDRERLARNLGFSEATSNSMHAVSDRDFVADFLYWAALSGIHLSRLAEDLVIYSSAEFSFVTIADQFSTGSSLMPQKKNADSLELIRGKTGRLVGNVVRILVVLKGLPSSFNKDMQEDKEGLFDSFDTIKNAILITEGVVSTLTVNREKCSASLTPEMVATDIAYWLVKRGIAFREAHEISGRVVSRAETLGIDVTQVPLHELKQISDAFDEDIQSLWDFERSVEQYKAKGGTSKQSVIQQIQQMRLWLSQKEQEIEKRKE